MLSKDNNNRDFAINQRSAPVIGTEVFIDAYLTALLTINTTARKRAGRR